MEQQVKSDGANIRPERPQGPLTNLERSEFYLREGERLAHMGSWSLRADGIFDYWSPETFVLFGFDPSEGIPTLPKWLTVLHPDDRDRSFYRIGPSTNGILRLSLTLLRRV